MRVRVRNASFFLTDCRTRLPFRFGAVTMTRAPLCLAQVGIETDDGAVATGHAADLLVPKWFDKDPDKSAEQNQRDLLASARAAAAAFRAEPAAPVFDLWWNAYRELEPTLVGGFGAALVERAVLDAACRAAGVTFFDALKRDLFDFAPGRVHEELDVWDLGQSLPAQPLESVAVRHTVGLDDPLRASDVAPTDRVDDGLPQALEDDIRRYGLTFFKVKIDADENRAIARLLALARVFEETQDGPARFTLDANEQFSDLARIGAILEAVARKPEGRRLLDGLLYVEQPLARAATFSPEANAAMPALREFAPAIIDEADHGLDAFPRALELGYAGVSVKNCKGVFRALLNRGLCERAGGEAFQSAEDLTNLPIVALQQDLATVSALGLDHVERNGHHYFFGLAHLPAEDARAALDHHPDLYEKHDGGIVLRIRDGRVATQSIHAAPGYGHAVALRTELREEA